MTPAQCRMARAAVEIGVRELAAAANGVDEHDHPTSSAAERVSASEQSMRPSALPSRPPASSSPTAISRA